MSTGFVVLAVVALAIAAVEVARSAAFVWPASKFARFVGRQEHRASRMWRDFSSSLDEPESVRLRRLQRIRQDQAFGPVLTDEDAKVIHRSVRGGK